MRPRDPEDPRATPVRLRRELVALGWTDQMLGRALRDGHLAQPRRGAYVDGAAWAKLDAAGRHELAARAVVASAKAQVAVSHGSAIPFFGGPDWGLDLGTVHVTRLDGHAGRGAAGVRQHRGRVQDGDVETWHGVPVMGPTRAALELTTMVPLETSVVHLSDLTHRGLTTPARLQERYEAGIDHWPHSLATDLALRLCEPKCESVAEARFLVLAWREHLPHPTPQYEVRDRHGRLIARVDFAWPEMGVFLEFDGRSKYTTLLKAGQSLDDVLIAERKRQNEAQRVTGWTCIRITWADLAQPARTAAMIRSDLYPSDVA